jgi:hypothetical protein
MSLIKNKSSIKQCGLQMALNLLWAFKGVGGSTTWNRQYGSKEGAVLRATVGAGAL